MEQIEKLKTDLKDTKIKTLNFKESLTIWNALKIKEMIINTLNNCTSLTLNIKDVEEYDFSFLQILLSLIKTSEMQGKEITIENIHPDLKNLIIESGFINIDCQVYRQ